LKGPTLSPFLHAGSSLDRFARVMPEVKIVPRFRIAEDALTVAGPPLLFGLRLWASVCLALYTAFWLELDNAFWAGTAAALACQPHLGASLRRGWFLLIGTVVGAVAIVVLTACFPQDRAGFLVGLALWGGACALVATLLHNFHGYAAALAGFTAAIVAAGTLGATGGPDAQVFLLAIYRASEVCIGIVCAGIVLAGTDLGGARRRLAGLFAPLSAEITGRFAGILALAGPGLPETRPVRRALIRRVIALDPVIDEAIGESSQLRYHSPVLQTAVDGLFAALAGWRTVATHLARLPDDRARDEAAAVLGSVPRELRSAPEHGGPTRWIAEPVHLRRICEAAVRTLIGRPAGTPSLRLLADQTAKVLAGTAQALDGLALLVDASDRPFPGHRGFRLTVPDWLPELVNGGRAFVAIGAVALFWVVSGWPNGAPAITFAAITVILFAPRADQAYTAVMGYMVGTVLAAVCAAIIKFAVLPGLSTFAGFSIALGLCLVPAGALIAQPWQTGMFTAMTFVFVTLLAPANQMSYDPGQFYNTALATVAGISAGAVSFRLLPPLSPAFRTRRLLALTLRDLRHLATGAITRTSDAWDGRVYARLWALPEQALPLQRAQLLAALSVGSEIIRLRRIAPRLGLASDLDAALAALAHGHSAIATARLARLDHLLAARPGAEPETQLALRARSSILNVSEALAEHASYFDAGAPR
jgi:uncharacterized membrane protein YccC